MGHSTMKVEQFLDAQKVHQVRYILELEADTAMTEIMLFS